MEYLNHFPDQPKEQTEVELLAAVNDALASATKLQTTYSETLSLVREMFGVGDNLNYCDLVEKTIEAMERK